MLSYILIWLYHPNCFNESERLLKLSPSITLYSQPILSDCSDSILSTHSLTIFLKSDSLSCIVLFDSSVLFLGICSLFVGLGLINESIFSCGVLIVILSISIFAADCFSVDPQVDSDIYSLTVSCHEIWVIEVKEGSSEAAVISRGKICWHFYEDAGKRRKPSYWTPMVNMECLESGSVLFECKDGEYRPLTEEEFLEK